MQEAQRPKREQLPHMQHLTDEQLRRLEEFRHTFTLTDRDNQRSIPSGRQSPRGLRRSNRSQKEAKQWSSTTENRALRRVVYSTQSDDYKAPTHKRGGE